jgi:hypothetical protein
MGEVPNQGEIKIEKQIDLLEENEDTDGAAPV